MVFMKRPARHHSCRHPVSRDSPFGAGFPCCSAGVVPLFQGPREGKAVNESERIQESSQYLGTLLRNLPDCRNWLLAEKNLHRRYPLTELYDDLLNAAEGAKAFSDLLLAFRRFKQRHFLRIGGRDLLGWADLKETTSQLSDLACVALQAGMNLLSRHPEWWSTPGKAGNGIGIGGPVQLVVVGLGKLGGHELNYVSDVDLLYLHALRADGNDHADETIPLLSRFCQQLSRLLGDSADGDRVFLVDHRLRPHGKDGPLVPSSAAAADYYLDYGRPWERQMLLKARPVAGDRSIGLAFLREVRPFVFRRFLDFQAIDELRTMRDRIIGEANRHRSTTVPFDVKLGVGGIREIEFLVQSMQLIYGGRHPELDEPNTLRCLDRLCELKLFGDEVVEELKSSYIFLRRAEHWVQLDQNRRTQKLPKSKDALERLSLALGFGRNEGRLLDRLEACCESVHEHFLALFGSGTRVAPHCLDEEGEPPTDRSDDSVIPEGFPAEALARLRTSLKALSPVLEKPLIETLKAFGPQSNPPLQEKVLLRLDRYFSQVSRRPGLMRLFLNPAAWLGDFCRGLASSELLAALLAGHPGLVEGVATTDESFPGFASWEKRSLRLLQEVDDYAEGLEWIRRLRNERLLQVVLNDLRGDISGEALEGELSSLADFVLQQTTDRVATNLGVGPDLPLAVLALGRLGSREMSYLSDLDLVFVYQPRQEGPEDRIPTEVVRFVQRLMRMLSTPLQEGPGYAVDARLRPTGTYGPLIVTRSAWLDYYRHQADLWEIQALLRIRWVAGNRALGIWIEEKAREICYRQRNPVDVWSRLCHLRGRMQRERSEEKGDRIDIKLGMGGLADLEFLAQGHALVEGHGIPSLKARSVRSALSGALENSPRLQRSFLEVLTAFETLRSLEHRLRLHTNLASSRISPSLFESLKDFRLWPPHHGENTLEDWQDLVRLRSRVRNALRGFCHDL